MIEVDTIGGYGHQWQAAEAGGGDERDFVHPGQCRTAEQGVVMVGGRREDGFGDAGYRELGSAFDF
ncbi:hypothetical protein D3C80_2020000 [compost metagenome]